MILKYLGVLILLSIVVSCNKKDDEVKANTSTPPVMGTYELCENADGVSTKTRMFLNAKALVGSQTVYSTANCQTGSEVFTERDIYSYTSSGTTFNMTLESVVMTPLHSSVVSALNTQSFCQYTNWSYGVPKKIVGQICDGMNVTAGQQTTGTIYQDGTGVALVGDTSTAVYSLAKTLDFALNGEVLSNGNYAYYDGSRAVYLTVTSPNFQMTIFDEATLRYYLKSGTLTSSNNVASFTTTTNSPDCDTDENVPMARKLAASTISLGLESLETYAWLFEKVPFTVTQFRTTYLAAGYTSQCF